MLVTILADDGDDEGLGLLPLLSYREFDSRDVGTLSVFLKEQIDRTQGVMMMSVVYTLSPSMQLKLIDVRGQNRRGLPDMGL